MSSRDSFLNFVLDQLQSLGELRCRAMFGGHGLYDGEKFFGIVAGDRLYLKTDEQSRADFLRHGMGPFRASAKQTLINYYQAPADVLENDELLIAWARRAAAC